jgi:hypothetical protein
MTVNMSLHEGTGCFDSFKYNLNELGKGHCRKVISIEFPAGRSEVENLPVRVEANAADLQGLEFVANYEAYVQSAVTSPISILNSENLAIVGSDFCVLSIRPFVRHPIAKFYSGDARATEGKFSVAVLGYSLHTHLYDGRGHLLSCTMKGVMDQFIASGRGSVEAKITMNPRATSFSQSVRSIGEKFIAEAVCGVTSTKPAGISGDEIFDRERTDPGIQALVVKGLSGSGVYVGDELIGLVSASSKYLLTEAIESELAKAFESGDEFRITAYTAIHPSVIEHPLLNIHQSVTQQKINELLLPESASSSVAAAP